MNLVEIINSLRTTKTECMVWVRAHNTGGYGVVSYEGKVWAVHRLVFALKHKIINLPSWTFICHSCDNRSCCNPKHLFLGNAKINNLDMHKKGRFRSGKQPTTEERAKKILSKFTWMG